MTNPDDNAPFPADPPLDPQADQDVSEAADTVANSMAVSDPEQPPNDTEPESSTISVELDDSKVSGDIHIEQEVNETRNIFIDTDGEIRFKSFSAKMATPVPVFVEVRYAETYCTDPQTLTPLMEVLRQRRILVITAATDAGKWAAAIRLAGLVRTDIDAMREAKRVRPLESDLHIDVGALASDRKSYGNRVLLFQDALARNNRDIRSFLESLDDVLIERMRVELEANGSYIIFTADHLSLSELRETLTERGLCKELPAPEIDSLRKGLNRALENSSFTGELGEELFQEILEHGQSMPRILRLARHYLSEIHHGEISVQQAFDLLDDSPRRFQEDLVADFDAWCFAFVLTLTLAVQPANGIPWTEFETFRKVLVPVIRSRAGVPENDRNYEKRRLSDDALLQQTLSTIERDPASGRDTLYFQNPKDAERLWMSLIAHNRGLLIDVYTVLIEIAETTDRATVHLRGRAAQIIGRLGEIDPTAFTSGTLRRWASSKSYQTRAATGFLLEGAWASPEQGYRERCLRDLDAMTNANSSTEEGRTVLWSAIAACKRIGMIDLSIAMRKLRDIAERNLSPRISDLHDMDRQLQLNRTEWERRKSKGIRGVADLAVADHLIREWSKETYDKQAPLLFATQYAVVALCLTLDPLRVLVELQRWLEGDEGLQALTVLMYLQSGGIAEAISECDALVDDVPADTTDLVVNPIAAALIADPESAPRLAAFLQDIFDSFNSAFPQQAIRYLKESFLGHLCAMANQTSRSPRALAAVANLFHELLTGQSHDLKVSILSALKANPAFCEEGSTLQHFSSAVVRRSLTG